MLGYSVVYSKSLREKVGSAVIEVPEDATDPRADAEGLARAAASELGAVFFVLEQVNPLGRARDARVFYTNYQGEEGPY